MKKMIVVGLGIMLSACALVQSEQQVQAEQKMHKFMYCAAAHDKLGDIAMQESKIKPTQFTQDDMLGWYSLSGAEAQFATQLYFKSKLDSPMEIEKYNAMYGDLKKTMTLSDLATQFNAEEDVARAEAKVGALAGKVGTSGVLDIANYDLVNDMVDGECMEMFSEYTTDMNIIMSQEPEASVAGRTAGTCVGTYDAISQIAAGTHNYRVAKAAAFHSGIMGTFLNSYINDENAEDIYDHLAVKGDQVFSGAMSEVALAKELKDCTQVYGVANQYVVNHLVDQPAQK